jgi:hypothetical protein
MSWLSNRRRKRHQKTIREVSGTKQEAAARLAALDDDHLAALADVATRAETAGKGWAFRVILPELVSRRPAADSLAATDEGLLPRELDRFVALRASEALKGMQDDVSAALPEGAALNREAALKGIIDLLRYGVSGDDLAASLMETIRAQPGNFTA